MSKKASASRVFLQLTLAVAVFLGLRWIIAEPYVIPSGSMIPTLLINDHILVTKYDYGIRLPFTEKWLGGPGAPLRGDVVVFKSNGDAGYFMVKRVVGLPGEHIKVDELGRVWINGKEIFRQETRQGGDPHLKTFEEDLIHRKHLIHQQILGAHLTADEVIPSGHIFLMGDNRDSSSDSRVWGPLPLANLMGRARWVWLSCSETLSRVEFICNPRHIRWHRLFSQIQ